MDQSLYRLTTAAGYGEARLAVVANNLANVNTPGFKADQVNFAEVLDGASRSIQMGQYIDQAPGVVEHTGNPLDLAVEGDGFFVVETPEGMRFTRDGGFRLSADGMLVTSEGHLVMGEGGALGVDPQTGEITIGANGTVFADGARVGRLSIVNFEGAEQPAKVGGNLFAGQGETPVGNPHVIQGALEHANVSAIEEMARMIEISRGYETYQKLIQSMDQVAGQTNEMGTV